jgi:hypothetical protein
VSGVVNEIVPRGTLPLWKQWPLTLATAEELRKCPPHSAAPNSVIEFHMEWLYAANISAFS